MIRVIFIFSILFTGVSYCWGQTFELSLGAHLMNYEGIIIFPYYSGNASPATNIQQEVGPNPEMGGVITAACYYPVLRAKNEKLSLGLYGALSPFLIYGGPGETLYYSTGAVAATGGGSDIAGGILVPQFLMVRFGPTATRKSIRHNEGIGFALGGGGMFTAASGRMEGASCSGTYYKPALYCAFTYNEYFINLTYVTGKYHSYYETNTGKIPQLEFNFFSVTLGRVLGF